MLNEFTGFDLHVGIWMYSVVNVVECMHVQMIEKMMLNKIHKCSGPLVKWFVHLPCKLNYSTFSIVSVFKAYRT